jgi:serine/threonine protein kinase
MGTVLTCCDNSKKMRSERLIEEKDISGIQSRGKKSINKRKSKKQFSEADAAHYVNSRFTMRKNSHLKTKKSNNPSFQTKKPKKDDFEALKVLGRGTFGKVVLVRRMKNNKLYAMKILDKNVVRVQQQVLHTRTEREILEKIDHPFIVKLFYAFQDDSKLYLVTEFMQGGELFFHLNKDRFFSEDRTRFYACEIILALEHLHSKGCIYRDLKPENILLDKTGHIKLTDFGLSKIPIEKADGRAYTICGTPEYLAPEVLLDKGYDRSVDWWSLGALIYEMLTGVSLFRFNKGERPDIEKYKKKIILPHYLSPESQDLIIQLLKFNPAHRLGYDGAQKIKSHPFFQDVNWNDYSIKKVTPLFIPSLIQRASFTNNNDNSIGNLNEKEKKIPIDLSNFDRVFLDEDIDAYSDKINFLKLQMSQLSGTLDKEFEGFTYDNHSTSLIERSLGNISLNSRKRANAIISPIISNQHIQEVLN